MTGRRPNLLLAIFKHESNTYSDVPTPLRRFYSDGRLLAGYEVIERSAGTGSILGGMLDIVKGYMVGAVIPCAGAGGCTSDYSEFIFDAVRRPIFQLHRDTPKTPVLLEKRYCRVPG